MLPTIRTFRTSGDCIESRQKYSRKLQGTEHASSEKN